MPESHIEYLASAIDAEPCFDTWPSWRRLGQHAREMEVKASPRFLYLAEGVAKRWGWGRLDEPGADTLHRYALRHDARRIAAEAERRR